MARAPRKTAPSPQNFPRKQLSLLKQILPQRVLRVNMYVCIYDHSQT